MAKVVKERFGGSWDKIRALAERNKFLRQGKKARINKNSKGYAVVVTEYRQ